MIRFTPFPWVAVLMLAITLVPGTASAQEDGTITISGAFYMDWLGGTVGSDLAEVYANGHEHTWTLTLHGTTASHETFSSFGVTNRVTEIHATSFELEFVGTDAATLNGIVSDHISGGEVLIYLRNAYWDFGDFAMMYVWPMGRAVDFFSGHDTIGSDTLFPSDADGYPVVGPDPFSIRAEYSELSDRRPGNDGYIASRESLITFEGSVGEPPPPSLPTLAIQDSSVREGNKGATNLNLTVTLSKTSEEKVTVTYATSNGTALVNSDYYASHGTVTFQPGQTSRVVTIVVMGDKKREANETFTVTLSNPVGATIADGTATATILNDD